MSTSPLPIGRGSGLRPPNRFGGIHATLDLEHLEHDAEYLAALAKVPTLYQPDDSRTIVSENDSPDLMFRYSLNPYRGCQHGCSYCYRPPKHATTPHLPNLYRTRTSGRIRWRGNRPGSTSKTGLR